MNTNTNLVGIEGGRGYFSKSRGAQWLLLLKNTKHLKTKLNYFGMQLMAWLYPNSFKIFEK